MKLLGSAEEKIAKDKNRDLQISKVVLVQCNNVNNTYQYDSRVLHTFIPNRSFGQLSESSPANLISLKTVNSDFSFILICFTDHNSHPLEAKDGINLTLAI